MKQTLFALVLFTIFIYSIITINGAANKDPQTQYLGNVEGCDVYISSVENATVYLAKCNGTTTTTQVTPIGRGFGQTTSVKISPSCK